MRKNFVVALNRFDTVSIDIWADYFKIDPAKDSCFFFDKKGNKICFLELHDLVEISIYDNKTGDLSFLYQI